MQQKYPALIIKKQALLQQNNTRPHATQTTQNKLQELDRIKLKPHTAYCPDLDPSDYNQEKVEASVKDFFS